MKKWNAWKYGNDVVTETWQTWKLLILKISAENVNEQNILLDDVTYLVRCVQTFDEQCMYMFNLFSV